MTILNFVYCVLGAVFIVMGAACLWEKYRVVRGGMCLPARVLECRRVGSSRRKRGGGYCYVVEFTSPDGIRHSSVTASSKTGSCSFAPDAATMRWACSNKA